MALTPAQRQQFAASFGAGSFGIGSPAPQRPSGAAPRAPQAQGVTANNAAWLDSGGSPENVLYEPGTRPPDAMAAGRAPGSDAYSKQYAASLAADNAAVMRQLDQALQSIGARRDQAMGVIATLPQTVAANYGHAQGQLNEASLRGATELSGDVKIDPSVAAPMKAALAGNAATSNATQPFLQLAANARYDEGASRIEAERAAAQQSSNAQGRQFAAEEARAQRDRQWQLEDRQYEGEQAARQYAVERATAYSNREDEQRHALKTIEFQHQLGLEEQLADPERITLADLPKYGADAEYGRILQKEDNKQAKLLRSDKAYGKMNEEVSKRIDKLRTPESVAEYTKAMDEIIESFRKRKGQGSWGFLPGRQGGYEDLEPIERARLYRMLSLSLLDNDIAAPVAG